MVFYKPVVDIDKLTELFPDVKLDDGKVYGGYIGFDDEESQVGQALVKVDGYNCFLLSLNCDLDDKLLVEGFVRAALNFSANRSAYMAYTELSKIEDVLLSLGFEKKTALYCGDIPSLLKGSCSHCK